MDRKEKRLPAFSVILCAAIIALSPKTSYEAQINLKRYTRMDLAIHRFSMQYEISSDLLRGIRWAESLNGKYRYSDSTSVVSNQQWALQYKHTKALYERFGRDIYACIGDFQVLFLTAHTKGYRGGPDGLYNSETNVKYACEILKPYLRRHAGKPKRAVASYNLGHVRYTRAGQYVNKKYVDRVWSVYTNGGM